VNAVDGLLRGRRDVSGRAVAGLAVPGLLLYGAAMGSWAGRPLQMLVSAVKLPLLLLASALVCLPALWAMGAVLGLRGRDTVRAVASAQAALAVALASFAPLVLVFYASIRSYRVAVLGNGVFFLLATGAGHAVLRRQLAHAGARRAWTALYGFVAVQSAWVLRPFVGDPSLPVRFFREDAWRNAYVVVARTLWRVLVP